MTYGKAAWLLPALMLHAAGAGAATREEVERFTASQQPGSALVCRGEGALEAGVHRMTITSFGRATVVSRRDGRQHLRAEAAFATDGVVYARYTYEMDSWLEDDAEVSVIVPESIHVLVPENKAEADAVARTVEASGTQRLPFRDVDASGFPEWDLPPQPDDPTGMRVHCGPEDRAG